MQNEKDQTHDQHDVDEARAYVKCQKPEQPENNQNQSEQSKHVLSPYVQAEKSGNFKPHSADGY